MANATFRFVVHHVDANKKKLAQWAEESIILSAATKSDGTPDMTSVKTVLTNNGRLRGADIQVSTYSNVDKEHAVAANILT